MFHMQAGGAFSNIFGSPGGTDGNYPMIPNETYTITMELVKNTTWGNIPYYAVSIQIQN